MESKEIRRQHLLAAIKKFETIEALAEHTKANPKHLSQCKNGTRGIGPKLARKMEAALNLNRFAWDQPPVDSNIYEGPNISKSGVPLISFTTAGDLCATEDPYPAGHAEDFIPFAGDISEGMYALRVQGDSMTSPVGQSIPDGYIIFVDPTIRAENGDLVIARDGDSKATFKKLYIDGDMVYLKPLNPDLKPRLIQDELHICGVVVSAQMDLRRKP